MFEHPWAAKSWSEPCVQRVANMKDVRIVKGHMCRFHMKIEKKGESHLVKKATGFMTNSSKVASQLNKICLNDWTEGPNSHKNILTCYVIAYAREQKSK